MLERALLPHVAVILYSVSGVGAWYQSALPKVFTAQHYVHGLSHELVLPSVQRSIEYASLSVVLDLVLGLTIAWLIVRSKMWGRQILDGLAMLPLAVPGLVLAFGFMGVSLQVQGWIDRIATPTATAKASPTTTAATTAAKPAISPVWQAVKDGIDYRQNPTILLVIAYAMRRLPYVVRSAVAGLEQTPEDLELAAKNLGASSGLTLRRITIPLISANLIAGGLLAFAFAILEVSDSLILAQPTKYWPVTKAIYELFQRLRDGPYIASALGVWAMLLLTLTILAANSLLGKRMGAIFRV